MSRYSKLLLTLAALLACAGFAPLPAAAGCPGCEEYTLDIPDDGGGGAPAAPAPAPAPAPTATAPAPVAPETTTDAAPATAAVAPTVRSKPDKPADTDPDPVPAGTVKPPELASVPAVAASQAGPSADTGSELAGLAPLVLAMAAVALAAAAIRLRRGRTPGAR